MSPPCWCRGAAAWTPFYSWASPTRMHTHSHPHSSPPWWLWAAGRAHWAGALLWFLRTHSAVSEPEEVPPQCGLQLSAVLLLSNQGSPGPLDTLAASRAWLLGGPETPPSPAWPALPAQQPCRNTPFTRPHPLSSWILGPTFLSLSWSIESTDRVLRAAMDRQACDHEPSGSWSPHPTWVLR